MGLRTRACTQHGVPIHKINTWNLNYSIIQLNRYMIILLQV